MSWVSKGLKKLENAAKNLVSDKDDRAEHCFDELKKNNIEICSEKTGEQVSQQEFEKVSYVYHGNLADRHDLNFCMKAFEKRGFIDCKLYKSPQPQLSETTKPSPQHTECPSDAPIYKSDETNPMCITHAQCAGRIEGDTCIEQAD